eukprot:TRINITY_DN510_c6_g1_i2.p2 TRINITY_DN510_c6_g1~~TRINITY_DN510_c6_g1_i2.p2  ORF type:complete len:197 (+),score=61.96 TRINITY_DN510_c6_g1_i2:75-593(+)
MQPAQGRPQPKAKDFMVPYEQLMVVGRSDTLSDVMGALVGSNLARRRCYVLDESQMCVGMLGMARLTTAWNDGRDPRTTTVAEYMRSDFAVIGPDATLDQCRDVMGRTRLHHVVVTENGRSSGKVIGAMTAWLVAQEQAVQVMSYPHNRLARQYQRNWAHVDPAKLRISPKL